MAAGLSANSSRLEVFLYSLASVMNSFAGLRCAIIIQLRSGPPHRSNEFRDIVVAFAREFLARERIASFRVCWNASCIMAVRVDIAPDARRLRGNAREVVQSCDARKMESDNNDDGVVV